MDKSSWSAVFDFLPVLYCMRFSRPWLRKTLPAVVWRHVSWETCTVESNCNVMAHGEAREGKWSGNWRMECVSSTLYTTSEHGVSSITTADTHTSAASSRLNWRPLADLNGLVRLAKRWNLVSARVPSHFNWPLPTIWRKVKIPDMLLHRLTAGLQTAKYTS